MRSPRPTGAAERMLAGSARGLDLARPSFGSTGVRTAAIQLGRFGGAAVGGLALAVGGYTALALLFVAATVLHLWLWTTDPAPRLR